VQRYPSQNIRPDQPRVPSGAKASSCNNARLRRHLCELIVLLNGDHKERISAYVVVLVRLSGVKSTKCVSNGELANFLINQLGFPDPDVLHTSPSNYHGQHHRQGCNCHPRPKPSGKYLRVHDVLITYNHVVSSRDSNTQSNMGIKLLERALFRFDWCVFSRFPRQTFHSIFFPM
jgi:hypothetical protein